MNERIYSYFVQYITSVSCLSYISHKLRDENYPNNFCHTFVKLLETPGLSSLYCHLLGNGGPRISKCDKLRKLFSLLRVVSPTYREARVGDTLPVDQSVGPSA